MSAEAARRENSFLVLARIPVVRRLWAAITFSSFGDWLGLLATTALAQQLTHQQSVSAQGAAIGGVLLVRLSPDLFLGPIAAAAADKWDRRKTVVAGDLVAGLLYASIAIGYNLVWLYIAQFVIEAVGLFTQPAKQVIQTTVVPKSLLATANQVSLFSVYGTAPIAAGVFALLSAVNRIAGSTGHPADVAIVVALLLDAVSFLISSGTVFVSRRQITVVPAERERQQSIFALLREGVGFVRGSPLIKALYVGIVGAFAAGGLTIGVALLWVKTLSAGAAGYAIMFGTVFTGLAVGMLVGPKVLPHYTRSRVFALAIASAGASLLVMSVIRDFVLADGFAALVGLFAGMAWIIGYTLIGQEVEDRLRGRVFAFVLSSVRLSLLLTIAVGPVLAGLIGGHSVRIADETKVTFSGPGLTLLIGGVMALLVGYYALARATPSDTRLRDLARRRLVAGTTRRSGEVAGLFLTVDGVDPTSTARCATLLADEARALGLVVTVTDEPADSPVGRQVRGLLAESGASGVEPETAALLSSAERAEHVAKVIRPALERGEVVVCDRYVLTAMALYGGGRGADVDRIRSTDSWGTDGLRPDLTLVVVGEWAPAGMDEVLRQEAAADPDHNLVVAGSAELPVPEVAERLQRLVAARGSRLRRKDEPGDAPTAR